MKKTKLFFINGIILTLTSLLMRGISLIFNIYISNRIGSEAVGIFSLIMSVYSFAITIATSGIGIACTCIVSEKFAKKNYTAGINAVKTSTIFALSLGSFASVLIILFSPMISYTWLKNMVSEVPLYLISIGLPLIAISSVINGYFSSVGKPYKNAISQILETSVKIIATIYLLNSHSSANIESICISLVLADIISEIFSFSLNMIFYLVDTKKYKLKRTLPLQMKRKILKMALPISITSCIRSGLYSFKQFLIPVRLELSGLSYSLAISHYGLISGMVMPVIMFANVLIMSFSGLLIPEFSRLLAGKNFNRLKNVCDTIFKITFVFSLCITGIFIIFANDISLIIYQSIEPGKWIKILAPLIFFMYIDNIIDNMLKGINEQISVMICNIIDLLITISIIFFVIPFMGIYGYILSIFFSEILNFTISSIQLKKRINYSINIKKFILQPILALIISYIIIQIIPINLFSFTIITIIKISLFTLFYIIFYLIIHNLFNNISYTSNRNCKL